MRYLLLVAAVSVSFLACGGEASGVPSVPSTDSLGEAGAPSVPSTPSASDAGAAATPANK